MRQSIEKKPLHNPTIVSHAPAGEGTTGRYSVSIGVIKIPRPSSDCPLRGTWYARAVGIPPSACGSAKKKTKKNTHKKDLPHLNLKDDATLSLSGDDRFCNATVYGNLVPWRIVQVPWTSRQTIHGVATYRSQVSMRWRQDGAVPFGRLSMPMQLLLLSCFLWR